jgi:NAD+ kinase
MTPKFFILGNPNKLEVSGAMSIIRQSIEFNGAVVMGESLSFDASPAIDADYVVVVGGDGTMLAAIRSLDWNQLHLIGVNFGHLGFLTCFTIEEFQEQLPKIIEGNVDVSDRLILSAEIVRLNTSFLCANDFVINAGDPFRVIYLEVKIDGITINTIGGDGVIISTPTGSTAYNLSAGGPVLMPDIDAIIINPINPHSLTYRPLVVNASSIITIIPRKINKGTCAVIDGFQTISMEVDEEIVIRPALNNAHIVQNPKYPKWHNLVAKFQWGNSPRN